MWEILLGYALEKVFGSQTTAFEIGGEYVQTSVPGYATPQATSKVTSVPLPVDTHNPSLVCYRPEAVTHRHGLQLGFNPFTPVILKGAEIFVETFAPVEQRDVYD